MRRTLSGALAACLLAAAGAWAQPQEDVLARVRAHKQPFLDTLKELTAIESGSRDLEGLEKIARLIEQLDDDDFEVREKASEELALGGARVRESLQEASKSKLTLEQKRRVAKLLTRLRDATLTGSELLQIRAAEVLGKIGTNEARELIRTLPNSSVAN